MIDTKKLMRLKKREMVSKMFDLDRELEMQKQWVLIGDEKLIEAYKKVDSLLIKLRKKHVKNVIRKKI